jgi:hypothetical protein
MPLYFVHVRDGGALLPDDGVAQEFATLDDVRDEVTESVRQILSRALMGTAAMHEDAGGVDAGRPERAARRT